MADRPIIFSAPMVRALLASRKTATRRILMPQPPFNTRVYFNNLLQEWRWMDEGCADLGGALRIPYVVGDRLWVRETCRAEELPDGQDGVLYAADDVFLPIQNTVAAADRWSHLYHYRGGFVAGRRGLTVPPIHMPRWASRLTLTVTSVKVERLQDISEEDAFNEGVCQFVEEQDHIPWGELKPYERLGIVQTLYGTGRKAFQHLWESIHGADAWLANPWICAVSFTVHRHNIDREAP